MKFFLDENLSPQHAAELRSNGHDVYSVAEVGLSGAKDEQILQFAIENQRVLITLDADFAHILRFPPAHTPGVLRLKVHPPTEEGIRQTLQRALSLLVNTDLAGCLAVVDENKIRIRR